MYYIRRFPTIGDDAMEKMPPEMVEAPRLPAKQLFQSFRTPSERYGENRQAKMISPPVHSSAMKASHQLVGLLLAALALVSVVHATPIEDTPFEQLQVRRWLFNGSQKIADWEPLQFAGKVLQVRFEMCVNLL